MTRCDHCNSRLDEADATVTRRGTFCSADCEHRHAIDLSFVPVLSDEQWLIEPDEVQPNLPAFCHP